MSSLVLLSSECPDTPVGASHIIRLEIVEIPPQAPEAVLARLQQQIILALGLLINPLPVAFHVPLGVTSANDGDFRLEQLGKCLLPVVRARRMAEPWMEKHEAIEVRIKGREVSRLVDRVIMPDEGTYLHSTTKAVLNFGTKGVDGCLIGHWEFPLSAHHAFRPYEDEVEIGADEHVAKLQPDEAR